MEEVLQTLLLRPIVVYGLSTLGQEEYIKLMLALRERIDKETKADLAMFMNFKDKNYSMADVREKIRKSGITIKKR